MRLGLCVAAAALLFPATTEARTHAGWQLALSWPADGAVTSPFGIDGTRWHSGLDIGVLQSTGVRAAADGAVTKVGYVARFEGYGNIVMVAHRAGYSTLYAHLSLPLARVGQKVSRGESIGVAGCTGWCTGTHLHFELRYRDRAIDPSLLMY